MASVPLPATVREQAIEGLQALLQSITTSGTPIDANGNILPSPFNYPFGDQVSQQSVFREPPGQIAAGRRCVIVLTEGVEQKTEYNYGLVECELVVFVEGHILRQPDENMSVLLNGWMGIVERAVRANRTYNNTSGVIDTLIHGNDKRLDGGPYKNYGDFVIRMTIKYRHTTLDPTIAPGPNTL
jgi:hypothetical protein